MCTVRVNVYNYASISLSLSLSARARAPYAFLRGRWRKAEKGGGGELCDQCPQQKGRLGRGEGGEGKGLRLTTPTIIEPAPSAYSRTSGQIRSAGRVVLGHPTGKRATHRKASRSGEDCSSSWQLCLLVYAPASPTNVWIRSALPFPCPCSVSEEVVRIFLFSIVLVPIVDVDFVQV